MRRPAQQPVQPIRGQQVERVLEQIWEGADQVIILRPVEDELAVQAFGQSQASSQHDQPVA